MRTKAIVVAAAVLLGMAGPLWAGATNETTTAKSEESASLSDLWIAMKIKTLFLFHKDMDAYGTEVDVTNGVVTLRGKAETVSQKELATEYAKDVEGVKEVHNEMMLPQPPKKSWGQMFHETVSDTAVTTQVKMALAVHQSTSALATEVSTQDGVVTIRGKAKDDAEKTLVTKLVEKINGVKEVKNEMTVVPPPTNQ